MLYTLQTVELVYQAHSESSQHRMCQRDILQTALLQLDSPVNTSTHDSQLFNRVEDSTHLQTLS